MDTIPSSLKTCIRCRKQKPISDFEEDGRRRDNLYPYCKDCHEKGVIVAPWMKECSRCGNILPTQDFFMTKKSKDGLSYYCKKCDAAGSIPHPVQPRTEKKCIRCQEVKPISEFGKNKHKPDRFDNRCKQCKNVCYRKAVPQGSKSCSICKAAKPLSEFHRDSESSTGFRSSCKQCESAQRQGEYRRNYELKKNYGITLREYEELLRSQNGTCAICKKPNTVSRYGKVLAMHVDHCHITGRVRGLLCGPCNTALGNVKEDPEIIQSLLNYVYERVLQE